MVKSQIIDQRDCLYQMSVFMPSLNYKNAKLKIFNQSLCKAGRGKLTKGREGGKRLVGASSSLSTVSTHPHLDQHQLILQSPPPTTNSPPPIIPTNGAPKALHFRATNSDTLNQDCSAIFLLCFSFPFVIWLQSGVSWIVGRLLFSSLGKKTGTTLSLPGTISHFYLLGYQCLYFLKHLEIKLTCEKQASMSIMKISRGD